MRSRGGAALLIGLALLVAACANAPTEEGSSSSGGGATVAPPGSVSEADLQTNVPVDAPGVTDDAIRIGGVASVTNPLGAKYDQSFKGVEAYVAMVNSEGGIYGRQLEVVAERDDQVVNNQSEMQALISQDEVFAILPVTTLLFTGADLAAQEGVPTFGWNINAEWAGPDNLFGEKGSYICLTCGYPVQPWLAQELGRTRVGVLAYGDADQSKQCAEGIRSAYERWPVAEVVYEDSAVPIGATDLSVQVSQMKDADVDFVNTCMDNNGVTTLAKEIQKQGLDAVQYLSNGYDYTLASEFSDVFEGSYVAIQTVPFETEDKPEGLQDYLRWIEEVGGEVGELSLSGWLNADLFYRGLAAAGPEFSREKVIAAINAMTDWDAGGISPGWDWTYSHTEDPPETCYALLEITSGGFEPRFSDPGTPFLCLPIVSGELSEEPEQRA